ncbi:MAG: hypothetical protein KDE27_16385 [Planctomycetes bacterium]|nr:hypothetical protein [Planctomycetota bacterium]
MKHPVALLLFLASPELTAQAGSAIMDGSASFGVSTACSISGIPPLGVGPYHGIWDRYDVAAQPSGGTATWHGWGRTLWNVSAGPTVRIIATGWSTEGFNGSYCGNGLWLYGRGHANFAVTVCLDQAYTFTSSATGEVMGVPTGTSSGTLAAGLHCFTGHSEGNSNFSLDVTLTPTGTGFPTAPNQSVITFPVTCPPNDYAYFLGPLREQPPLDYDLDNDNTPDSWNARPIGYESGTCSTWPLLDEVGAELVLVCVPDPAGPSRGRDHFEARYRTPTSPPEGWQIGDCGYPNAANRWIVEFDDTNSNTVPDAFSKSTWTNYELEHVGGALTRTGCARVFVADFETQQLTAGVVTCQDSTTVIADAVIVPLGTDLGTLTLNGAPITKPGTQSAGDRQAVDDTSATFGIRVDRITAGATPSAPLVARVEVENATAAAASYQLDFFAVNAVLVQQSATLLVPAGSSATFEVTATVAAAGPAAILALVSDAANETYLDAAIFPEPAPNEATTARYGAGCYGATAPELAATPRPLLGTTVDLTTSNLSPATTFATTVATFDSDAAGTDLAAFGMPGCAAHVGLAATVGLGLVTPNGGTAVIPYAIPSSTVFLGANLFLQSIALDPSAGNAAGIATSNAVFLHFGSL